MPESYKVKNLYGFSLYVCLSKNPGISYYLVNPNGELIVSRADNILIRGVFLPTTTMTIAKGLPYDKNSKELNERNIKVGYSRPNSVIRDKTMFQLKE